MLSGANRFNTLDAKEQDACLLSNGHVKGESCSLCKVIISSETKLTDIKSNKKWLIFALEHNQTAKETHYLFYVDQIIMMLRGRGY